MHVVRGCRDFFESFRCIILKQRERGRKLFAFTYEEREKKGNKRQINERQLSSNDARMNTEGRGEVQEAIASRETVTCYTQTL